MTAILNIAIPVLAGVFVIIAVGSLVRAFGRRSESSSPFTYGVGRQEVRHAIQSDLVRGFISLMVGLILLGVFGLRPLPVEPEPTATLPVPTPTSPPAASATPRPQPTPTAGQTPEPTLTSPVPPPTDTPPSPTETVSPASNTALVNSPNGLWLRATPSTDGTQLENLADGTTLTLLPGREFADEIEWQQVRAPSGNEGWVAVEFIVYQP